MRCPKCHYLAFDSGERCRNCGYEFSLAVGLEEPAPAELPIRPAEPLGPLADLTLRPESPAESRPKRRTPRGQARRSRPTDGQASDLPLFLDADPVGQAPLVRSTPRAPLAVRRATPARVRTPPAEMWTAQVEPDEPNVPEARPAATRTPAARSTGPADLRPLATPIDRVIAGSIDLILILAIDIGVVYFTVRILDLPMESVVALPRVPLLGFLALLDGGYFVAFTAAGGQTLGKMARQIQVVGRDGTVHVGQAVTRTLGYVLSALPVGLGFVAMALGPDGVALHDRLADTRVVRCQTS